jgi:hypothetical protein
MIAGFNLVVCLKNRKDIKTRYDLWECISKK